MSDENILTIRIRNMQKFKKVILKYNLKLNWCKNSKIILTQNTKTNC